MVRPQLRYVFSTRRSSELYFLSSAWLVGVIAWVLVDAGSSSTSMSGWTVLLSAGALLLLANSTVRRWAPYADPVLLPCVALLNMIGLAMIHRLDVASAQRAASNGSPRPTPDVYLQLTWMLVGLVVFIATIILVEDHRQLQRLTWTSGLAGVILLFLPLIPGIGSVVNGGRLWINVLGFTFQPSEIAKIALAIFFAGYLVNRRHTLAHVQHRILGVGVPRFQDLGPLLVVWLLSLLVLVLERDLGTSLLLFGLFTVVLYVATGRRTWVFISLALLLFGGFGAYLAFGHVRVRFSIWLDPFSQATENGFQIVQSLFGLANGGIFGTGLGQGYPQLVPYAKTDFITSALGEELGLCGLIALLMLYVIIIQRGARAAVATRDSFGGLLAIGLTSVLGLQTFIVIGGVTRLIPLTGLTTPFLSYGGSSLVANYLLIALLIRISNAARTPDNAEMLILGQEEQE